MGHEKKVDPAVVDLAAIKGAPRSLVYRILRTGQVRVNGGRAKAGYRLQPGDRIRIPPLRLPQTGAPPPPRRLLERLESAILYEDPRLLVLDKPAGLAVHGGSGLSFGVIEGLRALRPQETGLELVHRLDRDTSGVMVFALSPHAQRHLGLQFEKRQIRKTYVARVAGEVADRATPRWTSTSSG